MLRFAANPTSDMHIGNLRVALLNYIVSKQRQEDLIVRIEDTDKEKNIEGKDQEIVDLLGLFGVEYSQVIYQSQNVRFHSAMALQLMHEKKAFSCFCSPNWLENKREEATLAKKEYLYDDACRDLPAELVIDNTNPFTIRIVRPDETIVVRDQIKGDISFEPDTIDSFVIMHQDKTPTSTFASAIDDMLADISLVICDEEHINTTKENHIRASLQYNKKVEYAHLPKIIDEDSISIKWLLEEGYLPSAISNYLISIGNNPSQEIFELQDAIEWFDLTKISNSPTRFDINILKDINKKHLLNLDAKELSRYVGFADEEIGKLARVYLEKISTTKELRAKIEPIFAIKEIPEELSQQVQKMTQAIKSAPYFEEYGDFKEYVMKEVALNEKDFSQLFRLMITGTDDGPEIAEIYKYLKNYIGEIIK
jgi:glutamyl-tRNA synthetase